MFILTGDKDDESQELCKSKDCNSELCFNRYSI